ncbi:hypothetical protein [Kibdelosporangium philippinense]|uniref:hypothetical protein n=1 Tax=Kibdelosporangium philippinense TaxID=211113 RepID=UPI0036201C22
MAQCSWREATFTGRVRLGQLVQYLQQGLRPLRISRVIFSGLGLPAGWRLLSRRRAWRRGSAASSKARC